MCDRGPFRVLEGQTVSGRPILVVVRDDGEWGAMLRDYETARRER